MFNLSQRIYKHFTDKLKCFFFENPIQLHYSLRSQNLSFKAKTRSKSSPLYNCRPGLLQMFFLFWNRPTPQEQMSCISRSGTFNYDIKYKGATAKAAPSLKEDTGLSKDGFVVNHARVLLGSGIETYEKGKSALQNWRHFSMDWAFVDSNTPIREGEKFSVCTKSLVPWLALPLQMLYVNDVRNLKNGTAHFKFGGGTLQGHLLAGEERFSVELDENNQVWYEIVSFSKPANLLSVIGYPYVKFQQKQFADQSSTAVLKHVTSSF